MQKAQKRFHIILQKYKNLDLTYADFEKLDISKKVILNKSCAKYKVKFLLFVLFSLIAGLIFNQINLFDNSECLIDMPSDASKWFREPESCDICERVNHVEKIANVSSYEFYEDFVRPATPVVVTDGATQWNASKTFTFDFFKNLYLNSSQENSCQFFPYQTEFRSLNEALEMSSARANLEPGEKPWYIGWSNCNDQVGKILRKHYDIPYFLPNTSENMALNWIFMGGPGQGAHMHVDNVRYPSWQAQLKGRKMWRLAPPPECYYKCREMSVTINPGEIIVLDTNRWYHQTFIQPGEISITIGSEFD